MEYAFRMWGGCCPKEKRGCGAKVRCPNCKLGTLSAEARAMVGVSNGVSLLVRVCAVRVVLSLLLMAGDVERNPGPTQKGGNHLDNTTQPVLLTIFCYAKFSTIMLART